MIKDNYMIIDFMFSVNDNDFYMSAITFGGDKKKIKLNKPEFLKWCRDLEDDEQGWQLSEYQRFYNIL